MRSRKKYSSIWRNRSCLAFLLPSFLGVSIFVLIPFADVVRRSFVTSLSGESCGFDNYVKVLQNQAFGLAVKNSLRFVAACLPVLLALSLIVAVVLCKNPAVEWIRAFYLLPMAMPAATIVLVWRLIFAKQGFLGALTGVSYEFMEGRSAFFVLIATYIWKNLGFTVVLWMTALKTVPQEIKEAAKIDGAGSVRTFFFITMPYLKEFVYTIVLLSFLNTFKVFREVYLIGGAYPDEEIYLLQHVFQNWYAKLDMDKMAAGAVLSALVLGAAALMMGELLEHEKTYEK